MVPGGPKRQPEFEAVLPARPGSAVFDLIALLR